MRTRPLFLLRSLMGPTILRLLPLFRGRRCRLRRLIRRLWRLCVPRLHKSLHERSVDCKNSTMFLARCKINIPSFGEREDGERRHAVFHPFTHRRCSFRAPRSLQEEVLSHGMTWYNYRSVTFSFVVLLRRNIGQWRRAKM